MADKFPRVTKAQVEIWLSDPVTQALQRGLQEVANKVKDKLSNCTYVDPANNDLSMNEMHKALGARDGLLSAAKFEEVLNICSFIEVDNEG